MLRLARLGLLLVSALVPGAASAETAQSGAQLIDRWLAAVGDHRAGEADNWAVAIADWPKDHLASTLREIPRAQRRGQISDRALRQGAILHLDIAFHGAPRASGPLFRTYPHGGPRPSPTTFLVLDGREEGRGASWTHLEFARALLKHLEPGAENVEFVRLWYDATAARLASLRDFAELSFHLDHARRILSDDPAILLATGCLHETFAAPRTQAVVRATAGTANMLIVGTVQGNLSQAERYYRRALSVKPDLAEARLRLGRVLGLDGKHEEAVVELKRAVEEAEDEVQRYYALLFLGREEVMLGRLDGARLRFERAAALYPSAQAPQMSLSRLAAERGDDRGARDALDRVLSVRRDMSGDGDPWWLYDASQGRYAERKLAALYAAAGRERR